MYKVIDYWGNGCLDIMHEDELLAEVKPSGEGMILSFSIKVNLSCRDELNLWLDRNVTHMLALNAD